MDNKEFHEIALNITIKPVNEAAEFVPIDVLAKYLFEINKSFCNFVQIEFYKNAKFEELFKSNPKYIETFLQNYRLYVVDTKIGSFESALAPLINSEQVDFFSDGAELNEWKFNKFKEYKEDVFINDYNDIKFLKKVTEKYNDTERTRIFSPIINMLDSYPNYHVTVEQKENPKIFRLLPVEKNVRTVYISKREKPSKQKKFILAFLEVDSDAKADKLRARDLNKVIYSEEMDHMIYPYKLINIEFDDLIFELNYEISCPVEYEDDTYFIKYEDLDISVWGSTREEVEEAFAFSFYSLYNIYYIEKDDNLSEKAIVLKRKLHNLIKSIISKELQD